MIKKFFALLLIVVITSSDCYAAEDYEFGPQMYMADIGSVEIVANTADAENAAFAVSGSLLRVKSKTNFDLVEFDLLLKNFADGNFVITDTKNRSAVLFGIDEDGSIYDSKSNFAGVFEANVWHSFIIAFDASDYAYVYMDNTLLTAAAHPDNMLGIYSMGFEQGTAYYDNTEFSYMTEPQIVNICNNNYENGLSEVVLEFNTPVLIDGEVTKKYVYCPSSPLEFGQSSTAKLKNIFSLINDEINIDCTVTAGEAPQIYFVNKIQGSSIAPQAQMTIYNPYEEVQMPVVYACVYSDEMLASINVYDEISAQTGVSSHTFPINVPDDSVDYTIRIFVWKDGAVPYSKASYVGVFEEK